MNSIGSAPFAGDIKSFISEEEALIRSTHFSGASGSEVVQRRTALIDRVLRSLYGSLSRTGPLPLLIAIGGYGRGELNPFSDIDLLFLCREEGDRARTSPLLYALWDAGLDIGYSVRNTSECIDLARSDTKIRTSLLESRLIAGDPPAFRSYLQRMQAEVFHRKPAAFLSEKIAERKATRLKYGGSLYLREPNIKESSGGLRDFHTARWLAFTHFRITAFSELVSRNIVTAGQLAVCLRARNFLWRLRNELHYLAGRKHDQLTFDYQEAASRDFRYRDTPHLLAVERFMKTYFLYARIIREFSRMVIEKVLPARRRFWQGRTRTSGPFTIIGNTLTATSDKACGEDPVIILRAFERFQADHMVLSEHLREQIAARRLDEGFRSSPEASRVFLSILDNPERLTETLISMKDLKFLGRYLPEFRSIQALTRRDYYHTYTIDEHILTAVQRLEDVWAGRHPGLPTLYEAFRRIGRRWVLMLAVLMHDLGKAYRADHEIRGREIAAGILDRLGIAGEDRSRILLVIVHHLLMSNLSQRRELSDRKVIAEFARTVKDRTNLDLLYLLTYADMAAVSPSAWTPWKAALLQELYLRTQAYFEEPGTPEELERSRLAGVSRSLQAAAAGTFSESEVDAFQRAMPAHYLLTASVRRQLYHLALVRRLARERLIIEHRNLPNKGYTELTVCAYDAYGMFYRTAGTIAAQNLNILRAQVFTGRNGITIDTFQITDVEGRIIPHEDIWETVKSELRNALTGARRVPVPHIARREEGILSVPVSVSFDNDASDSLTVIDITAQDRVGLLYRVTKTLYDLNLDIASAKIVTEGRLVMDSFYVSDLFHERILDPVRLEKIHQALLTALA